MSKHAYLIMAHNEYNILYELLVALDDERNDIFVHIDKKAGNFPNEFLKSAVNKGNLFFIDRMRVFWGGYSQILCEIKLMSEARKHCSYDYYHMLTGVFYPLRSQNEMHEFFDKNQGAEFIGFDNSKDYSWRVKYVHIFSEIGKAVTPFKKMLVKIREKFVGLQTHFGIEKKAANGIVFKKGIVYWSLTDEAIQLILSKTKEIKKLYKHSFCADELFAQTIVFNSEIADKIYNTSDDFEGSLRIAKPPQSWEQKAANNLRKGEENSLSTKDVEWLMDTEAFFAMKFCGQTGLDAINMIKERK